MKIYSNIKLVFLSVSFFTLVACGGAKKARQTIQSTPDISYVGQVAEGDTLAFLEKFQQSVQKNEVEFNTFSARLKVSFTDKDQKNTEVNAFVRMYKDSVIWVSINALLGIEAVRAYITPDSVKIINKLDKKIQLHSVAHLQELINLPLDFNALQNLIVGNAVYFHDAAVAYQETDEYISVLSVVEGLKNLIHFDRSKHLFQQAVLTEVDETKDRVCTIQNSDYQKKSRQWFSLQRLVKVEGSTSATIQMWFRQYDFNQSLSYPFNLPKDYTIQ